MLEIFLLLKKQSCGGQVRAFQHATCVIRDVVANTYNQIFLKIERYIMKKKFSVILLTFIIIGKAEAQKDLNFMKELPPPMEVKAPVFNTISEYNLTIDSLRQVIYIQDIRKSENGRPHFYQWLYELPIDDLKFEIEKPDENEINITISSLNNKEGFISYWFQDKKISSVLIQKKIVLGKWKLSEDNLNKIENCVQKLTQRFSNIKSSKIILDESKEGSFKYIANNIETRNAKIDENRRIGDYLLESFFIDNNKPKSSKIVHRVEKKIKENNINTQVPIPVIIYSDGNGNYENIEILSTNSSYPVQINSLKIKPFNKLKSPTKYLFLVI